MTGGERGCPDGADICPVPLCHIIPSDCCADADTVKGIMITDAEMRCFTMLDILWTPTLSIAEQTTMLALAFNLNQNESHIICFPDQYRL
jgi:hypothetical protein